LRSVCHTLPFHEPHVIKNQKRRGKMIVVGKPNGVKMYGKERKRQSSEKTGLPGRLGGNNMD